MGGALAKVRYPSGNWVSYDINGANRISQVRKGETGSAFYMKNAAYNAAGALVGATLGLDGANQWTETRGYNSRLQARRVEVTKGASTLLRLRWAYSGAYNSTTLEETGTDNNGDLRVERLEFPHQGALQTVDRTYAYTGADRLVSFTEPSKSQSFTYDAFGNVWQYTASGVPALRQNGASWYLQSNGVVNNRLADTAYDAAGNQTQLSVAPGTVASYDGENRMSKIAVGGSEVASYTYDAEGRRVAKTAGSTTTWYVHDAFGQLAAEYKTGGPAGDPATHYVTTDHLGSTRLVTDGSGNAVSRHDYLPFGEEIPSGMGARTTGQHYITDALLTHRFTGKERDTETGLDYFGARYLSGVQGRWTSADAPLADQHAIDPQSWNMYAYVANNSLRYIDSGGRQRIDQVLDAEARAYLAGKMTRQQMLEKQKARAVGAVIGIGIAAAPELPWIARALITLGLTHPEAAQEGAVAIAEAALGMEGPGTPSLTGNLGRLSQVELSTGTALASRLGRNLSVSGHVGSEFVDAFGKTYDAMGSAKAFQHPKFDIGKFGDSMLDHFRKSNNHTVIDLRGPTKEQIKEIRKRAGDMAGSSDHFIFID